MYSIHTYIRVYLTELDGRKVDGQTGEQRNWVDLKSTICVNNFLLHHNYYSICMYIAYCK